MSPQLLRTFSLFVVDVSIAAVAFSVASCTMFLYLVALGVCDGKPVARREIVQPTEVPASEGIEVVSVQVLLSAAV